ncbi:MAG: hypothetical protein RI963_3645, partial [Planctomycetota bacterium]
LEPGEQYRTITQSAVVPLRFRGTVYLIVQTDANGAMEEWPNEANNTFYRELYVVPQPLPDLVTSGVVAPTQAIEGATIEVRFTVTNLGPGTTPVNNWSDTVWLTRDKNRPHPGQGDFLLKTLSHKGALANKAGYDVVTTVTLPTGLASGTYYITPWTDPYDVVLEDTLADNVNPDDPREIDNNNYKARAIDVIGLSRPLPDLTVSDLIIAPTGTGGEDYTIRYTVTNEGKGNATGSWIDQIWLVPSPDTPLSDSAAMLLTEVRNTSVDAKSNYQNTLNVKLSPSAIGSYVVVVSDYRRQITESDESNNALNRPSLVSPRPADLKLINFEIPQDAKSGEITKIRYTIQNVGDYPVWSGTGYWTDYLWISADAVFDHSRATQIGRYIHSNSDPLLPGQTLTAEVSAIIPNGLSGEFFVYFHLNANDERTEEWARVLQTGWWPAATYPNSFWIDRFSRWAFENPFNNLTSAPINVTYFEPDLVLRDVNVPTEVTSGETVTIGFRVINQGNRSTRTRIWTDRVFLSRDTSLDRFDTMIGEFARDEYDRLIGSGESYRTELDVRIPDGIEGSFYLLVLTDSPAQPDLYETISDIGFGNRGVKFQDPLRFRDFDGVAIRQRQLSKGNVHEFAFEGNNTVASPLRVTLATPPDLQVTQIVAPPRVRAGQAFEISYTVQNFGGVTPPAQAAWDDLVYLSRDRFLDLRSDRFLGQVRHTTGLAGGASYTQRRSFQAPAGFDDETEEYYLFVITDPVRNQPRGSVFELTTEYNNDRATSTPIVFELPPPTDLQVTQVTVPAIVKSGEPITVGWTVTNMSDKESAEGQWFDTLYLSSDATWDIGDAPLGRLSFTGKLAPGEKYTQTLTTLPPAVTPGQYRVIARADIFNQLYEREFDKNNAGASAEAMEVTVEAIEIDKPHRTTLSTGQVRLFKVVVPHDKTLRITLNSEAEGSANEIFLRHDKAPTLAAYDAAYRGGLGASVQSVIPSTQPGTYYVLVRGYKEPADNTPVTLLAEFLPLAITKVNTDVGGDTKFVTTTIEGARFHEDAILKLIRPGFAEFLPVAMRVVDSTKIIATFDFTDAPHGLYDVTVINPGDVKAVLPYRFLIEQAIEPDVTIGIGGPRTILAGDVGTYSVALQSISNVDTPYVFFQVGIPELLRNDYVYNLPFVQFASNLRGGPDGRNDIAWAQIDSAVNTAGAFSGTVRAPGYLFDTDANGFTGFSFNVLTYPGLRELHDRNWEELVKKIYEAIPELAEKKALEKGPDALDEIFPGLTDIYKKLAAVPSECEVPFIPFRFHLVAAATAMTREEFVAHSLAEAETLRQAIIDDDSTVAPALLTLAADRQAWGELFLAALEEGGMLRDDGATPPIREREKIVSLMAVLASGVILGPSGNQVRSTGSLLDFFEDVRTWYGNDPKQMAYIEYYDQRKSRCRDGEIPVPFESFRVYVPWLEFDKRGAGLPVEYQINGPQPVDGDEFAQLDLSKFFQGDQVEGLASITGPQTMDTKGWLPAAEPLPYSVNFANSPNASQYVQELRVVAKIDEGLDVFSFRLGDIKIGKINVRVPADRALYQGEFDFTTSEGFILRISAGVDQFAHEATWLFQAIDPLTGELLQDPTRGLLAPNNALGHGQGFVSYTIVPDDEVAVTGGEITASARVLYNNAPPEDTPPLTQRVDMVAPKTILDVTRSGSDGSKTHPGRSSSKGVPVRPTNSSHWRPITQATANLLGPGSPPKRMAAASIWVVSRPSPKRHLRILASLPSRPKRPLPTRCSLPPRS